MPIWDKQTYEKNYSCNGWPYGIRYNRVPRFHYNWFGQQRSSKVIAGRFLDIPGANQISDLVIVGGGYGWTAEILESYGINAISVDISPHINGTKDTSEEEELRDYLTQLGFDPDNLPDMMSPTDPNTTCNPWDYWLRPDGKRTSKTVVDEDMSTTTSRNVIKSSMNNKIDMILSEYAIDSVDSGDDAASLQIVERCEQLRPNPSVPVVHLIESNASDVVLNVKTSEAWRTLLDSNGFNHVIVDSRNILLPGG